MQAKNTAKDPRCPVCGNAVLGSAVYGGEGAYHPKCTQAPERVAAPPIFVPVPMPYPVEPSPYRVTWDPPTWPQITCDTYGQSYLSAVN